MRSCFKMKYVLDDIFMSQCGVSPLEQFHKTDAGHGCEQHTQEVEFVVRWNRIYCLRNDLNPLLLKVNITQCDVEAQLRSNTRTSWARPLHRFPTRRGAQRRRSPASVSQRNADVQHQAIVITLQVLLTVTLLWLSSSIGLPPLKTWTVILLINNISCFSLLRLIVLYTHTHTLPLTSSSSMVMMYLT